MSTHMAAQERICARWNGAGGFTPPFRKRAGFTLIEMLVVLAIIGILTSIMLASLSGARRKARDAQRVSDIRQLQLALELYSNSQLVLQYPEAKVDCATEAYGLKALVDSGYIPQVPRDPSLAAPLNCFRYTSTLAMPRRAYHLGATLEEETHPGLNTDKDCNSTLPAGTGLDVCARNTTFGPAGTTFDGTAAAVYDVVP